MSAFVHEKRRARTARERAELFAERGGCCAKCKRKLGPRDRWDLDHVISLSSGGSDDDENLQVLCEWCHDGKTPGDVTKAAKIKRQAIGHTVPKEFRKSRSWGKR